MNSHNSIPVQPRTVLDDFDVIPSLSQRIDIAVVSIPEDVVADALAVLVSEGQDTQELLGLSLVALERAGFTPSVGSALAFPSDSAPVRVAVGIGARESLTVAQIRDTAAGFARAVPADARLATRITAVGELDVAEIAAAVVEGIVLSRYKISMRSVEAGPVGLSSVTLLADESSREAVEEGARRGYVSARSAVLGRDLAGCPAGILTAERIADLAVKLGEQSVA